MKNRRAIIMWVMAFVVCALIVNISQCQRREAAKEAAEAQELKEWQASPEYSFRACLSFAAAGSSSNLPASVIEACNKAAGR